MNCSISRLSKLMNPKRYPVDQQIWFRLDDILVDMETNKPHLFLFLFGKYSCKLLLRDFMFEQVPKDSSRGPLTIPFSCPLTTLRLHHLPEAGGIQWSLSIHTVIFIHVHFFISICDRIQGKWMYLVCSSQEKWSNWWFSVPRQWTVVMQKNS